MLCNTFIICFIILFVQIKCINLTFPENFIFGVSTSAYQIEGAWNEEGKGKNIWDTFTQTHPDRIYDHSTGNTACNSYHKYEEDIQLLKYLGVDSYRFSLSWSRILPTGHTNKININGIKYYNNLINELLVNKIQPMVTLYHWDLPQPLQDIGGWPNPALADYFEDYARVVFENFGDRVTMWLTFNEPKLICLYGYGDVKMAPGVNASGVGEYLCGRTILNAHARVYRLYDREFRKDATGKIGIALHTEWFEPASNDEADYEASNRKLKFDFGWFCNPIYHSKGDYPPEMIKRIAFRSKLEGFSRSRLQNLTSTEIEFIKGTFDFLGLNVYTASMVGHLEIEEDIYNPNYKNDVGVRTWKDLRWPSGSAKRQKVVPWSLRKLLKWIQENYGNISIIITENGYSDYGALHDIKRILYIQDYLYYLLMAINEDGINVQGYYVWSLLDNFEWFGGYKERYGLFAVNFHNKEKTRTRKESAKYYKKIIQNRKLIIHSKDNDIKNNGKSIQKASYVMFILFIYLFHELLKLYCINLKLCI